MNESLAPLPAGWIGPALGTLRHALADPLSAAGLKLEVLERRLAAVPGDGLSLADRVRGAKADLSIAGRLIDLLPRLASIAGEPPRETSIGELCGLAGVALEDPAAPAATLWIRRLASTDALRIVAAFLRQGDPGGPAPRARLETVLGSVGLRIEGTGPWDGKDAERLLGLPHGDRQAEELFLARASIEADGGSLALAREENRLVATARWPVPAAPAGSAPA